jgi:hypothetical protein
MGLSAHFRFSPARYAWGDGASAAPALKDKNPDIPGLKWLCFFI